MTHRAIRRNGRCGACLAFIATLVTPPGTVFAQTPDPPGEDEDAPADTLAANRNKIDQQKAAPLTLFGDARFRLDLDHRENPDGSTNDRTRPRFRARVGAKYQTPLDGLSFGIRLASNPGTPGNSPHQTMDANADGSGELNLIALDRAYFEYAPTEHLTFVLGKQGYPNWQQTETMWDEDIQPEGLSGSLRLPLGERGSLGVNLGHFYLKNNGWMNSQFRNERLTTWQARLSGRFGRVAPSVAITAVHMFNVSGGGLNSDGTHDFGDTSFYQGSLQVKLAGLPVKVQAGFDYHFSTATADTMSDDHTTGMVGQVRLGKGRFGVRYYYYAIQEASVPFWGGAVLSQDNFPNSNSTGLTGFTGHRIQFDVKLADNVSCDLRIYLQQGDGDNELAFSENPDRKVNRYQLNLNAKF